MRVLSFNGADVRAVAARGIGNARNIERPWKPALSRG